ncbi:MAG: hypothetical protein ACQERB_13825 [Promethearchaeati archaeon]
MFNDIVCDIEFYNSKSQKLEQVIGRVNSSQLISEDEREIIAKNLIRYKGTWKLIKNRIYKNDIKKIIFY